MPEPRVLPVSEAEVEAIVAEAAACAHLYHPGRPEFRGQAFRLANATHAVLVPLLEGALEAMRSEKRYSCTRRCAECWATESVAFWDHLRKAQGGER